MDSNQIVFITGANTGLGFEIVKSLLQSDVAYTILLGGRSIEKANTAAKDAQAQYPESSSTIETIQIDIEDDDSINQAFVKIIDGYKRLDVLINNAGTSTLTETATSPLPIDKSPPAGWPKSLGMPAYRASKCGMNMLMRQWFRVLKEDGVKVWCVSPGHLATGLGGLGKEMNAKFGAKDPALGGQIIREVVEGKEDENVGKVVRRGGPQPW
ncbi:putative Peroxisomal trans-2-enoyl-CoA reductase [Glarea lozoyensis 74030]|uniref:Putative Peroxisomal trans-2-enoyl-CoA reductase n=1 Tax=Glarea lozoyensis (strain ATCC 74030 / MF5533) TaxID=1104152 RepID=H0EF89_GLAL7|nr:putative Peroxisomal trans-2-enoyl-CoA reductase [Glarea lozoyensis 74030]